MTLVFKDEALLKGLAALFEAYPPGNLCDILALKVSQILDAEGYEVAIITLENRFVPGTLIRPPYIPAWSLNRVSFLLAQTGFHVTVRIRSDNQMYYLDSLVFLHHGVEALMEQDYLNLFVYPAEIEMTKVQQVE
jgi:hypothetical protein